MSSLVRNVVGIYVLDMDLVGGYCQNVKDKQCSFYMEMHTNKESYMWKQLHVERCSVR